MLRRELAFVSERCGLGLPNLHLPNHVHVVAEDGESSDSARTTTLFLSIHNLFSQVSTAVESNDWHSCRHVFIPETPEHA